jgi:ferredoxin
MKVEADRDVCIGAGMCVMNAEEVFDQDDEGLVVVLAAEVPPEHADAAARAVAACPSGALRLARVLPVGRAAEQAGDVQVEKEIDS